MSCTQHPRAVSSNQIFQVRWDNGFTVASSAVSSFTERLMTISASTSRSSLSYAYRWIFSEWNQVPQFTEQCSPTFEADGVKWVLKLFKGRTKTPNDLAMFLKMVGSDTQPLRGIKKKVRIIFAVENLSSWDRKDYGKMEHPVWYSEKHATWGEESVIALHSLPAFRSSTGQYSFSVKFEVLKTRSDPPTHPNSADFLPFMQQFFNSPSFSDVTFRATFDDKEAYFYAHKVIMASASPWFETLFTNGMKETYSNEITLADTDPTTFKILLQYCYGIKADLDDLVQAENILIMADRFGIDRLKEEAFRHFRLELSPNTVWNTWAIADKYGCKKTYMTCEDYVSQHFPKLIKNHSFYQAKPNILIAVLKQDIGNFTSEEELYEAVVRWAKCEENVEKQLVGGGSDDTYEELLEKAVNDIDFPYESGDEAFTDSFENLTTADIRTNPPIPDLTSADFDLSILNNPFRSQSTNPIKFEDTGIIRRHSFGMLERRKRSQQRSESSTSEPRQPSSFTPIRELFLPSLLQQIRFPQMSPNYLTSTVASDQYIMGIDGMKDLLLEAYAFHLSGATNQSNMHRFRARIQRVE